MVIITNNSMVCEQLHNTAHKNIRFIEGNYEAVLIEVRNLIHNHYKLLTHPLSGSIKPNETPYKTIALETGTQLDYDSLHLIEKAIATYEKMQNTKSTPDWTERVLDDFRTIDCDLFINAIKNVSFPT